MFFVKKLFWDDSWSKGEKGGAKGNGVSKY